MAIAYLITGSNMGVPQQLLQQAAAAIEQQGFGKMIQASSMYKTAAWGRHDQPDFLNQILKLDTNLPAEVLLKGLLLIEEQMGRRRLQKNDPRIIDIDILFYGNDIIHTENLTVPHPLLQQRRFVLTPLAEVAPDLLHPVLKKTIRQLLDECTDPLYVNKFYDAR